jgi:hypothetical protein
MEELKILQKTFDMMNYAYPALAQYPKGEKFALVVDIKRCMDVGEDYRSQQEILQEDYSAGIGCRSGKTEGICSVVI